MTVGRLGRQSIYNNNLQLQVTTEFQYPKVKSPQEKKKNSATTYMKIIQPKYMRVERCTNYST